MRGVLAGMAVVAALAGVGILASKARRPLTVAEHEARRQETIRAEPLESRMRRLGEEGSYGGWLDHFREVKVDAVEVQALEGAAQDVSLPKGATMVAFLLEDVAGESPRLEASGLPSVELKPEEGTRAGSAELPEAWEGRVRLTLRDAGYARLAFAAPLGGRRTRAPRPGEPRSLEEALSRAVQPLRAEGYARVAEFLGDRKSGPYLDLSAPGGDLLLVWALDPRTSEARGIAIDVTRRSYEVKSVVARKGQAWSGTVPLSLQPGKYVLAVSAAGRWAVSVYRKP